MVCRWILSGSKAILRPKYTTSTSEENHKAIPPQPRKKTVSNTETPWHQEHERERCQKISEHASALIFITYIFFTFYLF